ncbi:MAG: MFS transporter [Acidobacteriaceae bacterium]|nr:MFS transporter [Acidobacteriaceae bacterium]
MVSSEGEFDVRFWLLIGATFLGFLGIGTVLPALAPHVKHDLSGSDQTVGWVIGTFSFVALGSRFFSGPLADRRGRKITFLTGLLSCALAGAAYMLPIGLASAYAGRMLQGFGEACLYTGAAAWAVEVGGVQRSSQALGYVSSGIWGGISAGPVVGGWLRTFPHAAAFQFGAAMAAFVLALVVREDFEPVRHSGRHRLMPSSLLMPGLAIGFVNVHYPVIAGFLILYLAHHGGSGPAAFSTYALVILLSRFFLGSLPDRIHAAITFYFGIAAMAIGLLILAAGPRPAFAIGAAGLLGFGFSFPWSSIASTVLRRTPPQNHGSVVGILSAFYDLFVGLGSLLAGRIADRHGYSAAFLMAALALTGAAIAARFVFTGLGRETPLSQEAIVETSV